MKLIEEVRKILEEAGYDLVEPGSGKTLEYPKEIRVRYTSDERVELEPHIFEANDIRKYLEGFKISEHNPEVSSAESREKHGGYYSIIVERN